jgi:hypothetical protein
VRCALVQGLRRIPQQRDFAGNNVVKHRAHAHPYGDLVLAQPNIHVDLFIAAARARRDRVFAQFLRPSFQPLIPKCAFISFEEIEKQMKQLESFSVESGARVSGLLRGEKFKIPENIQYPAGL